jgi:glycosyltransferase involved in cell wall biosynthesis
MRILHVIPQFPYFGGRTIVGGHASCVLSLSLAQHHAGNQVAILSYIEGHEGPCEIEDGPIAYSLFSHAKTRTIKFGLQFSQAAVEWLSGRRNDYDVIHVHSGYADYFMVSARLKEASGIPTLHTMYCPIPEHGGRWRLPGIHYFIRRCAGQIDARGGTSQHVVASMVKYGMKGVERLRPALDIERFDVDEDPSLLRRKIGVGSDDLMILFVGNAKPQKNAIGVVRALPRIRQSFPNAKLVVTTELKHSSSDSDLAKLASEVNRLGLGSCIIQMGIVHNMPALMSTCDVLVAPFLDSFGPSDYFMAALEAMACGKPVVVSDVGGMPEVISNDVGRVVDPFDIASIASGVGTFLADKQLRLKTGANARALVERKFHPEKVVESCLEVYRRIAR